jgi:serine/threonine-protein kinase
MLEKIGNYKVIEEIGKGAMAVVYKAIQPSLNRTVAIKVLSQELTSDSQFINRFNRESAIIAQFNHPNIVHVIDKGSIDNTFYFVMDLIEGRDFKEFIADEKSTFDDKMNVFIQVCKGLSYAHRNGVIHRDIKPSNILVDTHKNAWLSDFGIAKMNGSVDHDLTCADMVLGTLNYMSPEQRTNNKEVDHRSDIYALGIILYEIATGKRIEGLIKEPRKVNPEISAMLEKVILKCLEQEKNNRYKNVDDLKDNLLKSLKGSHIDNQSRDGISEGLINLQDKFQLLDIIKQDEFSGSYLFNDKEKKQLIVIKAFPRNRKGFKIAKSLQELENPHIVKILGVGEIPTQFIVVMEYIEGGNLQDRMLKEYHWREIIAMGRQVASGLNHAHKKDITHGNLRPCNILFTKKSVPMVTDFILESQSRDNRDMENRYAPPEPVSSPQGDIYALGVILYQLITHKLPEKDKKTGIVNLQGMEGKAPLGLRNIIKKMLEKSRSLRYRSFDEVISDIKNIEKKMKMLSRKKVEDEMRARKKNKIVSVLGLPALILLIIGVAVWILSIKYPEHTKDLLSIIQGYIKDFPGK